MRVRSILLALVFGLAIPSIGLARPYRPYGAYRPAPGPYISGFLGVSVPRNTDISGTDFRSGTGVDFSERAELDPSVNVGGTAGFDFGLLRLEGELSYKHGEITTVTDTDGNRFTEADGRIGALALLVNAWLDLHNNSAITPYFGGGIGFAEVHLSDTYATAPDGSRVQLYRSDDDSVFAYQAGAGIGIALTPQLTLDLGYRYFGTARARFVASDIPADLKLESHNLAVALRVNFF